MDLNNLKEKLEVFLKDLGYELYDLQFKKKTKNSVLTVFIDHENGISIENCVEVTQELNPYIDELDPIKGEYFLEVSSPGAEKELRSVETIKKNIGKFVHVETDEQKIEGYLESFNEDVIGLKVRNRVVKISYEEVNLVRLAIKF